MEYLIINKDNNKGRISRLNKDLEAYKSYLNYLSDQSKKIVSQLHQRIKQKDNLLKGEEGD